MKQLSTGTEAVSPRSATGQTLVEFALVIGLFMLVVGGIVQFGLILWSQNAITEIARDTARFAVTQSVTPCESSRPGVALTANTLASRASLVGYQSGSWTATSIAGVGARGVGADWPIPARPPDIPVAEWPGSIFATDCPPADNRIPWFVRVRVNHVVPIFMPGLQFIAPPCASPGFCITSTTELRMEPKAS